MALPRDGSRVTVIVPSGLNGARVVRCYKLGSNTCRVVTEDEIVYDAGDFERLGRLHEDREGLDWCRGWYTRAVKALLAARAL